MVRFDEVLKKGFYSYQIVQYCKPRKVYIEYILIVKHIFIDRKNIL